MPARDRWNQHVYPCAVLVKLISLFWFQVEKVGSDVETADYLTLDAGNDGARAAPGAGALYVHTSKPTWANSVTRLSILTKSPALIFYSRGVRRASCLRCPLHALLNADLLGRDQGRGQM